MVQPSFAEEPVAPQVSTIKLRAVATAAGPAVTLGDVLDLSQADARIATAIGDKPVRDSEAGKGNDVAYEQVAARLAELGVNPARIVLSGAAVCHVTVEREDRPQAGIPLAAAASREPEPPVAAIADTETHKLSDILRTHIQRELQSLGGTIEVEFELAGREFLELSSPPFEFVVRGGKGQLGLRDFSVTIRREGRVHRTVRIGAQVRLIKSVLVAAKPLNIGGYIKRDLLEMASRVFTSDEELGIAHPEQVIGQHVEKFVPAGQMLRMADIKSVDLVKRSRPVTVEGGGSVNVHLTGVAIDSGGYGESVRVRLGESRAQRREIRGIVTGVGTVRMTEDGL